LDPLRVLFRAYTAKFERLFLDLLRSFELVRRSGAAARLAAALIWTAGALIWSAAGLLLLRC